eukprot:gene47519-biopygen36386
MAPRRIKFLDAISNGLDAATTYDIIQSLKYITNTSGLTTVISLLQPAPDVFYSFTDLILMADGQIIYHGLTTKVVEYFNNLGYHCPAIMDVADFLQEIPTPDGRRFTSGKTTISGAAPPLGTDALVKAWKDSQVFQDMLVEMDKDLVQSSGKAWPVEYLEQYPSSMWYSLLHSVEREARLLYRNSSFIKGRIVTAFALSIVDGTLFSNLQTDNINAMNGVLFMTANFVAMGAFGMLSLNFDQRAVFYKHSKGLFYPAWIFALSQSLVVLPLLIVDTLISSTIMYWSIGLSDDLHGSRYFTFMFVVLAFAMCATQFFRMISTALPTQVIAAPLGGTSVIFMLLFSGFIIPKSNIPPGWEWFYWINPMAHFLKAVTVNEFLSPDYDYQVCSNADCSSTQRYGDQVLVGWGNPTDMKWVWYSVASIFAIYFFFLATTMLALTYTRIEPTLPPPVVVDFSAELEEETRADKAHAEIPYNPVSFAFRDIGYTVTLPSGEKLDLLKGVSGFFEPGTVTALMGSSGAGKTTLLD